MVALSEDQPARDEHLPATFGLTQRGRGQSGPPEKLGRGQGTAEVLSPASLQAAKGENPKKPTRLREPHSFSDGEWSVSD